MKDTHFIKVDASKELPINHKNDCSKLVPCYFKEGRPITCYYNYHLNCWKTDNMETVIDIEFWLKEVPTPTEGELRELIQNEWSRNNEFFQASNSLENHMHMTYENFESAVKAILSFITNPHNRML